MLKRSYRESDEYYKVTLEASAAGEVYAGFRGAG